MTSGSWSTWTTSQEAYRRASGRRRYNAERQAAAAARQIKVLVLLDQYGRRKGVYAKIARELGVHRSTVLRDAKHPFHLTRAILRGARF
jgi:DNA invertase Pin-like site-specific DNA recombinase